MNESACESCGDPVDPRGKASAVDAGWTFHLFIDMDGPMTRTQQRCAGEQRQQLPESDARLMPHGATVASRVAPSHSSANSSTAIQATLRVILEDQGSAAELDAAHPDGCGPAETEASPGAKGAASTARGSALEGGDHLAPDHPLATVPREPEAPLVAASRNSSPRRRSSGQVDIQICDAVSRRWERDRTPISDLIVSAVEAGVQPTREQVDRYVEVSPATKLIKYNLTEDQYAVLDAMARQYHVGRQVIVTLLLAHVLAIDLP